MKLKHIFLSIFLFLVAMCSKDPDPTAFCQTCSTNSQLGAYLNEFDGILRFSNYFNKYVVEPPNSTTAMNYYIPCEIPSYFNAIEEIAVRITGWTYHNHWVEYDTPHQLIYNCIKLDTIIIIP